MRLKEYFEKYAINIAKFAKKAGVTRQMLHQAMTGTDLRLSNASKIVEASDGLVDYKDLLAIKSEKKKTQKKQKKMQKTDEK